VKVYRAIRANAVILVMTMLICVTSTTVSAASSDNWSIVYNPSAPNGYNQITDTFIMPYYTDGYILTCSYYSGAPNSYLKVSWQLPTGENRTVFINSVDTVLIDVGIGSYPTGYVTLYMSARPGYACYASGSISLNN